MKKITLISMIIGSFILASCGGGKTTNNDKPTEDTINSESISSNCDNENNISLSIENFAFKGTKDFVFESSDFDIKSTNIFVMNDSTVQFTLSNYTHEELDGDKKPDQIDIQVSLYADYNVKVTPGVYPYLKYDEKYRSDVRIITSEGQARFNWIKGMPDQGDVTIDYVDENVVCGSFNLNVEHDDSFVGNIHLNGSFSTEK